MKKLYRRLFVILSAITISHQNIHAYDNAVPLEHFACKSTRPSFSISPDGKNMLIINTMRENKCDISMDYSKPVEENFYDKGLILLDLETNETRILSDGKGANRIDSAGWLNNERIWYTARWTQGKKKIPTFGVNLDGTKRKLLWEWDGTVSQSIYKMAYSEPEHVYIYNNERRPFIYDYIKLNVYTGQRQILARGPDIGDMKGVATLGAVNDTDGYPIGVVLDHGLKRTIWEYKREDAEWVEHFSFNCQEPGFIPIGTYKGKLVVAGSKFDSNGNLIEENDTNAIYLYDYKTKTFGSKLYQDERYDAAGLTGSCRSSSGSGSNNRTSGEMSSINYQSYQPERVFFDKEAENHYLTVKAAFPNHWVRTISASADRKKSIVAIWSSTEPGEYYFVDLDKGTLRSLAKNRPWLDRSKLSETLPVSYMARDGVEIPAYLTLSKVKTDKNYFLIMPHGGPNTKQRIGYDEWMQFFTSRGVSVLQPDFRGSTGLGARHYMLGNKQWAKTMQDDISDGVLWAIENGYADADRVCIGGASYGGYATMAGLVFTPELYRCGINAIGVTDQIQILENFANRASIRQSWDEEPLLEWGDISTPEGKAYAVATSPVNYVKNIKAPLLVLQGSNDRTVEPRHAEDLIDKLKEYNKEYMAMFQAQEGHCVTGCGERAALEYLQIQEEFIDKYLKN